MNREQWFSDRINKRTPGGFQVVYHERSSVRDTTEFYVSLNSHRTLELANYLMEKPVWEDLKTGEKSDLLVAFDCTLDTVMLDYADALRQAALEIEALHG